MIGTWLLRCLFACLFLIQTGGVTYAEDDPDLWIGAAVETGTVDLKTKTNDAEVDKTGNIFGYKGFVELPHGISLYHIGLGLDDASISGRSKTLNIKQSHQTKSGYLETAWFWRMSKYVMPGFELRVFRGPGANFSVADRKNISMFYDIGPSLRFGYPKIFKDFDLMGQFTVLMSAQNSERSVTTLLAGVGVAYPIRLHKTVANEPAPPPPAPVAVVKEPEPAKKVEAPVPPPPKFIANLGAASLRFELSSATPDKASYERLTKLANGLVANANNWTTLEIFGHTDTTGKKAANLKLSKDRAATVKRILIEKGVAAEKLMTAEGFGDTKLLPGLAPTAPDHRRVELSFDGVKDVVPFNDMLEAIFGKMKK